MQQKDGQKQLMDSLYSFPLVSNPIALRMAIKFEPF